MLRQKQRHIPSSLWNYDLVRTLLRYIMQKEVQTWSKKINKNARRYIILYYIHRRAHCTHLTTTECTRKNNALGVWAHRHQYDTLKLFYRNLVAGLSLLFCFSLFSASFMHSLTMISCMAANRVLQ